MGRRNRALDRAASAGGAVLDVRLRDGENIGSGSGRRSLEVHQAKTLRWRRESCRALVSGGSGRVAACRLSPRAGVWTLSVLYRARGDRSAARRWLRVREIARQLGRAPSTISRELQRNAAIRTGRPEYRPRPLRPCRRRARRPKPAKLAVNPELRRYVQDRLAGEVQRPDGSVAGPQVGWAGRRHGPRKDRAGTVLEPGSDRWSATR